MHRPENNRQTTSQQHRTGPGGRAEPRPGQEDRTTRVVGAHEARQVRPGLSAAERNKDQQQIKTRPKQTPKQNRTLLQGDGQLFLWLTFDEARELRPCVHPTHEHIQNDHFDR